MVEVGSADLALGDGGRRKHRSEGNNATRARSAASPPSSAIGGFRNDLSGYSHKSCQNKRYPVERAAVY
ncbi:hypothetical protein BRD01_00825 [Halobacteriales archaeon QS_8_65_32]|nr:MAG: hypothetical protein BRD01_00825 [Halobacteriales archaeon QS_8_65_32]